MWRWALNITTHCWYLHIMVLCSSHYTDVAISRVCVINCQLHDGSLVPTWQLPNWLVPTSHSTSRTAAEQFSLSLSLSFDAVTNDAAFSSSTPLISTLRRPTSNDVYLLIKWYWLQGHARHHQKIPQAQRTLHGNSSPLPRGLNPIKLTYNRSPPDSWLH